MSSRRPNFANMDLWFKTKPCRPPWIQTSSATVDLKAAISSAMASAGVLHPRVFLGRLFIRFATSFSNVWLAPFRSVPLGMYLRSSPLVFSLLPRRQGACVSQNQISIFNRLASLGWQAIHCPAVVCSQTMRGSEPRS
jgi:hypothetical protein